MDPTNVDVPAFHEGFSDLVALFLHFSYADVVEQAIRESRGELRARLAADRRGPRVRLRAVEVRDGRTRCARASTSTASRRSTPTCLPQRRHAGPRRATTRRSSRTRSARCWCRPCSRRSRPSCRRKTERLFRIAGLDPQAPGRRGAQRRAGQGDGAGSERRRGTVPRPSASGPSTTARRPTWSSASTCAR